MSADEYTWQVYALSAYPHGPVRYVGVTKDAKQRLKQHRKDARRGSTSPVHRWIRKILEAGQTPICEVIEEGDGIEAAGHAERRWVAHWRQAAIQHDGPWLLNVGNGGEFLDDIDEFKRRLGYRPPNKREEP